MKIFAFRFSTPMLIEVIRCLDKRSIEVTYWTGSKKYFEDFVKNRKDFPNTIFHNTFEAVQGIGAPEVDQSSFEPISKKITENMLACESQALIMLNAIDLDNTSLSKKKHLYYEYVKYWYGVLTTMKPDAIIFGDIPHMSFQFVVYHLAKLLNIKVVMYRVIQIPGRMLFLNNYSKYEELGREVAKNIDAQFSLNNLSPDIQKYYLKQLDLESSPDPFYMKKDYVGSLEKTSHILPRLTAILRHIKQLSFLKTTKSYVQSFFAEKKLASIEGFSYSGLALKRQLKKWHNIRNGFKKEYEALQTKVDFSKKFIYVALHNQPECSTSAMGDIFVDQLLMIDLLADALPKDWVLYVKDSPMQWVGARAHLGRYDGYYRDIAKKKNVFIIPTTVSTYELINKSQAVATVTGTVAWEAVLRSKPAMIFGYTWFMHCDGVHRITDRKSCRQAMQAVMDGRLPDKQKVLNFLVSVEKVSTVSYPNNRFKTLNISEEENIKNIANKFMEELKI